MPKKPLVKPTPAERAYVQELVSFGVKRSHIAKMVGYCEDSLRTHFSEELDLGSSIANSKVAMTLYQMATSGEHPSATFFWLKTRAKWRETDNKEIDNNNNSIKDLDFTNLDDEERKQAREAIDTLKRLGQPGLSTSKARDQKQPSKIH